MEEKEDGKYKIKCPVYFYEAGKSKHCKKMKVDMVINKWSALKKAKHEIW